MNVKFVCQPVLGAHEDVSPLIIENENVVRLIGLDQVEMQ